MIYRKNILHLSSFWWTIFLGIVSGLSFYPWGTFLPYIIASTLFYYGVLHVNPQQAFKKGFLFYFFQHVIGLYWIGMGPYTVGLWYITPLAIACIPALMAFPLAVSLYLMAKITKVASLRIGFLVIFLSLAEWIRGCVILHGFPWNLPVHIWPLPVLQLTYWVGTYGLSLLTLLLIGSLTYTLVLYIKSVPKNILHFCAQTWPALAMINLFFIFAVFGYWRLEHNPTQYTSTNIRVIQPCIEQKNKWSQQHLANNFKRQISLSQLEYERPIHFVVWPESAVPLIVSAHPDFPHYIKEAIPPHSHLLMGVLRQETTAEDYKIWNSFAVINDKGKTIHHYDKSHLVPFGEYMPLKGILPFKKITEGHIDFSKGKGPQTIQIGNLPSFSPLICYEVIFPHAVINPKKRPEWLLNVTNDAWYGDTVGPKQHLFIARLRSIEEGIPLVRCANNGISAIFDAYGRILHKLEINQIGYIDTSLPTHLDSTHNFQHIQKNFFWTIIVFFLIFYIHRLYFIKNENKE